MNKAFSSAFSLLALLSGSLAAAQPVERPLVDNTTYANPSGPHERCGDYFVVETKTFGTFEVSELHIAFSLGEAVATSILYSRDFLVAIDDSKATPVLLMKRENHDLEKDTVKLSHAAYEDAKECLPAPGDAKSSNASRAP